MWVIMCREVVFLGGRGSKKVVGSGMPGFWDLGVPPFPGGITMFTSSLF